MNKIQFTKKFKFDLCAENLVDDEYVTEKIFDGICVGCVLLYDEEGNYLGLEVLNPKFIIRWSDDMATYNSVTIELFKNLLTNEKLYYDFKEQTPLLESSKKYIINTFINFEKQFERLIYD